MDKVSVTLTDFVRETVWVICSACGHQSRKHRVLHEKIKHVYYNEDQAKEEPPEFVEYNRFVECMGCESLKYVVSIAEFGMDDEGRFEVYPDAPSTRGQQREPQILQSDALRTDGTTAFPERVWKMYVETLHAMNGDVRILAAGGLRATVEAICLESGISGRTLADKIDELAKKDLLTQSLAELLHEERYLGNSALHELETPTHEALEDGLAIVEGLISTIYILPIKAERLRAARETPKMS